MSSPSRSGRLFQTGADYLHVRLAALLARREADGALPERVAAPLVYWRAFLVALAGGPPTP